MNGNWLHQEGTLPKVWQDFCLDEGKDNLEEEGHLGLVDEDFE